MRERWLQAFVAVLGITNAHAGTVNYSAGSTPACSAQQIARHDAVYYNQNQIDAIDPHGHFMGYSEGDGELWRNWEPVDGYKHVACGLQTHYGYYVGPWYGYAGEERDTNQFLLRTCSIWGRSVIGPETASTFPIRSCSRNAW